MTLKYLMISAVSVLTLSGCATSLQSLPPAKIASEAVRAPDGFTGLTQTQLPKVAPFKRNADLAGKARLLSAESFEGQSGGAWMDVSLYYDTPGQAADQMRVYNTVNWAAVKKPNWQTLPRL